MATAGNIVRDDATVLVRLSRSGFIYSLFLRQWGESGGWRPGREADAPRPGLSDRNNREWTSLSALESIRGGCQPAETVTCTDAPWQASWFAVVLSMINVKPAGSPWATELPPGRPATT